MRMSQLFLPTMRETPADATVESHKLMLRAGLIRKVAAGIYTYLPLGLRVLKKVSRIVEEEMNRSGAQEVLMPMVQPAELWERSGRYQQYGPELLRFKDRKESEFVLGPTHEEVITALVADHVKSYKSLPLNLYQIQTKFRDEMRPRFGLMRGREFLMKDAYSFCLGKKSQSEAYQSMWDCYHRIFERCGLKFRAVKAATGSIGGEMSHEFQVLAKSGEDAIASCNACKYAANVELAAIKASLPKKQDKTSPLSEVATPNKKSIDEVADFLKIDEKKLIKTLAYDVDGRVCLALIRGDHELSEAKLKRALKADSLTVLDAKILAQTVGPEGYIGPIRVSGDIVVIADHAINGEVDMVAGANKSNTHLQGVDCTRDFSAEYADLRNAVGGDACGECGAPFEILRGIEVGHIFYLGQKYSKALNACVQDENGENQILEMGSYGIGIGRTAAAAIEQNHDERGIIWPKALAPFAVHLVSLGGSEDLNLWAEKIYNELLAANVEVLFDDRDDRAGVKLNDADLIGCPLRITLGKRGLEKRELEVLPRAHQKNGAVNVPHDAQWLSRIGQMLTEL